MKSRIILYVSALLIYGLYRSYTPAPKHDTIEIVSDDIFTLNKNEHPIKQLEDVIGDFRKSLNPERKQNHRIKFIVSPDVTMGAVQDVKTALRKNGLLYLYFPGKPFWQFW